MEANILADLGSILKQLDDAEEVLCAAQLQLVIDTIESRMAGEEQACRRQQAPSLKGGSSTPVRP